MRVLQANLIGPAGYISMEDTEATELVHRAASGSLSWSRDFAPYAVLLPLIIPIRLLLLRYYDLYRVRGVSGIDWAVPLFKGTLALKPSTGTSAS